MDYRIKRTSRMILFLEICCFLFLGGCARKPPKWPVEKYVSKLEQFIESNNVSNLLVIAKRKSDWCHSKHNNATCIISSFEIIYAFDESFCRGDQIVTLNELSEESRAKVPHSLATENCALRETDENLYFVFFDTTDILKIDEQIVFPDKENLCVQKTYYLDVPVFPYTIDVIMNDLDEPFQMEPDKAMNAYLILLDRHRQRSKATKGLQSKK